MEFRAYLTINLAKKFKISFWDDFNYEIKPNIIAHLKKSFRTKTALKKSDESEFHKQLVVKSGGRSQ